MIFSNIEPAAGMRARSLFLLAVDMDLIVQLMGRVLATGSYRAGGVTALNYSALLFQHSLMLGRSGSTFTAPVDYKPVLGVSSADVDETVLVSATGNIPADFGGRAWSFDILTTICFRRVGRK